MSETWAPTRHDHRAATGSLAPERSSAEAIAKVVADVRAHNVRVPKGKGLQTVHDYALDMIEHPTVIDATAIYLSLLDRDEVWVYEDHPCIAPPADETTVCYQNGHGNVMVMHASVVPGPFTEPVWETNAPVAWGRVKWTLNTFVYIGGWSDELAEPFATSGPVHAWRFAIYDDGEPADLHWIHLVEDYDLEHWDMAHLVLLGTLNFLNCRNVELVEPRRPRGERRRLERIGGPAVHVLNIYPIGRSTRGRSNGEPVGGTPLTSVRGHFAHYGPQYDRGLLFGKHAGRFFIPQHARGEREAGEVEHTYRIVTEEP